MEKKQTIDWIISAYLLIMLYAISAYHYISLIQKNYVVALLILILLSFGITYIIFDQKFIIIRWAAALVTLFVIIINII